jgi:sterol desaturase/sphingolipid hydroxylase (fatty acid hydroxylase superfamily)
MQQYAQILLIAIPIFLGLIGIEKAYGHYVKKDTVPVIDAISSLYSGITNIVKDILKISVTLVSYEFLANKLALFSIPNTVLVYIIAFIIIDFQGYWVHRWAHQINFFWNKHAIHHSSEEFNLACALRQSISSFVNLFTFLLIPAAILGVPAQVVATILPIHLFMQFWYHTQHIDKMGILEKIIVTPSHHRVHHAINPEYIDKNHSQIFIFWDKLFGTFQEELPNVPAVYGITRPAHTWNPIHINFQHLSLLVRDAIAVKNWKDKWNIWFKPTGWRPSELEKTAPIYKIENVYDMQKYSTLLTKPQFVWIVAQFFLTAFFLFHFLGNIGTLGIPKIYIYGLFIFSIVYSTTEQMNVNPKAVLFNGIKMLFGMGIWICYGSWFHTFELMSFSGFFVISYLVLSFLITWKLFPINQTNPFEAIP